MAAHASGTPATAQQCCGMQQIPLRGAQVVAHGARSLQMRGAPVVHRAARGLQLEGAPRVHQGDVSLQLRNHRPGPQQGPATHRLGSGPGVCRRRALGVGAQGRQKRGGTGWNAGRGVARASLAGDWPFVAAVGLAVAQSLATTVPSQAPPSQPPSQGQSQSQPESGDGSGGVLGDLRYGAMTVLSFVPFFNWMVS